MLKNFIIKWDKKPFWEALGLHHAVLTLSVMFALWLLLGFHGAVFGWAFMSGFYFQKERYENGEQWEILDLATPIIIGGCTIALLNYLLAHGTISHIFF